MSDQALRELERRWRETGAGSDEAALVLARVRTGGTTVPRVQLAAGLGHPAARLAVSALHAPDDAPGELGLEGRAALERLRERMAAEAYFPGVPDALDHETRARLALAVLAPFFAECLEQVAGGRATWGRPSELDLEQTFRTALETSRAFCCAPDEPELAEVGAALREVCDRLTEHGSGAWDDAWEGAGIDGVLRVMGAVEPMLHPEAPSRGGRVLAEVVDVYVQAREHFRQVPDLEARVRQAQRSDLIPWLLGHGDPLRERADD